MAIIFHCEHCGKKIKAPDSAGGKWGKCSACHNKIYVPGPEPDEELKLTPIDENDKTKQKQLAAEALKLHLMAETYKLGESNGPAKAATSTPQVNDKQLTKNIIVYLRQMADGESDQAERIADLIVRCGGRAAEILDRIALSEVPEPELADIPQQVLSGLIRTLRTKIS